LTAGTPGVAVGGCAQHPQKKDSGQTTELWLKWTV